MLKWTLLKLKMSAFWRHCQKDERQAKDWEIIFAKDISEKGLLSKICKEFLNSKKSWQSDLKMGERLE